MSIPNQSGKVMSEALSQIGSECSRAMEKFPPFHSTHEGYAVLLEEVDELWDAIKANDKANMHEEAVQVGAMALRFVLDLLTRVD